MRLRTAWRFIREVFSEWSNDKASRLAAALSYYTVFSLAPLLLIVIAIAGFFFSGDAVRGRIVDEIGGVVGQEGAQAIQSMIESAGRPQNGVFATVIAVVALLFGASGVFVQLQDALNTVWEVAPRPDRPFLHILKSRFLSFAAVLGTGFLLLVSLILSAAVAAFSKFLGAWMPGQAMLLEAVHFVLAFGVTTLLFALIFKLLPDVRIAWSDVWIGAAASAFLFSIGKYLTGLYLGRSSVASAYGAAGTVLIIFLWVYYAAQIALLGAEFTQVYARNVGSGFHPSKDAVPVTEERRAEEGMSGEETTKRAREERPASRRRSAATTARRRRMESALLAGLAAGILIQTLRLPRLARRVIGKSGTRAARRLLRAPKPRSRAPIAA